MMLGIIIAGHGLFGSALGSVIDLIVGDKDAYQSVDFIEGMSSEMLDRKIEEAIMKVKADHIIIFTDILGGAPFRSASTFAHNQAHIEVVSGTNAQMVIEAVLGREECDDLQEFLDDLLPSAREAISSLTLELAEKAKHQSLEDTGI